MGIFEFFKRNKEKTYKDKFAKKKKQGNNTLCWPK